MAALKAQLQPLLKKATLASQVVLVVKNLPANAGDTRNVGSIFDPWVRKIPWKRAWQPTPGFLPGESPWTEEPDGLHGVTKSWT